MSETASKLEQAFREGYEVGYRNGVTDATTYEAGAGSRSKVGRRRDEDIEWDLSETKREEKRVHE